MVDKRYSCERVVPIEEEPRHHLVIENEFVRAFAVEIAPHDRTLCHHHPHDYLLYVVGDGEIVSAARDEEPKKLSYSNGECELLEAGMVHVVENLSDKPFRNIVVELPPGIGSLPRGGDPTLIAGEVKVTQLFDDERAAILLVEMKGESGVLISGPVVVAGSSDGGELDLQQSDNIYQPSDFNGLAWISAGKKVRLQSPQNADRRALVFQVGRVDRQAGA